MQRVPPIGHSLASAKSGVPHVARQVRFDFPRQMQGESGEARVRAVHAMQAWQAKLDETVEAGVVLEAREMG